MPKAHGCYFHDEAGRQSAALSSLQDSELVTLRRQDPKGHLMTPAENLPLLTLPDAKRRQVQGRLESDIVGWLVTVAPDGTPQASVISFFWDGDTILFYSEPDTWKLRNIAANPRVSFHLNSDELGNEMVAIEGDAWIDEEAPRSDEFPAYVEKYTDPYRRWGMEAGATALQFGVAVRIRPTRIRAW